MKRLATILLSMLGSGAALASQPQTDRLTYEGNSSMVSMAGKLTLPVPPSEPLAALRRRNHCSASGGPAAHWAVIDSTLYLTHFIDCGDPIPLVAAYDGVRAPLVATWISGTVRASRGAVICFTLKDGAVRDTALTFTVDQGIVTDVEESDNSSACPNQ